MSRQTELFEKWGQVIDHEAFDPIANRRKRHDLAVVLENTESEVAKSGVSFTSLLSEAAPVNNTGNVQNYDPVLISLVRRAMPNLIAYDLCGVQPMTGPTGLVFAARSNYVDSANSAIKTEAFYNEADTDFSGTGTQAGTVGTAATANTGTGMSTATAEALGDGVGADFVEMSLEIERVSVTANSRAMKAEFSTELAQDLKAIHGLDAEAELANMLSAELLAEINREVVRTIYNTAVTGSQSDVATGGVFDLDVDSNGRWMVEKFKGLMFQIEREANQISKDTRRGKGNIILCSSDVAAALQMAGMLDYAPALNANNLNPDDTGNTFVGVLNGRYRVYIDPYAGGNFMVVGYKGSDTFDAGLFYCPYVPLQMVRAVGENSFQQKIGFKTRYGMVANPFAQGLTRGSGALTANTNKYYRRTLITNLM
jgi:hypothetical protein